MEKSQVIFTFYNADSQHGLQAKQNPRSYRQVGGSLLNELDFDTKSWVLWMYQKEASRAL